MTGVAFVPSTPLLIPEVAVSGSPELDELRTACDAVVAQVLAGATRCVVVCVGAQSRMMTPPMIGTFAGFGVDLQVTCGLGAAAEVSWQAALGVWLVQRALWSGDVVVVEVASAAAAAELLTTLVEPAVAVVCVGDGSAGLGVKSPGYVIEGAEAFDDVVANAIADGDPSVLASLEQAEGTRVMAAGTPVWIAVGSATAPPASAQLTLRTAPHGVGYFVGLWRND